MSALVAGTLAPDAPVYWTGMRGYALTHSIPGVLLLDPWIAVALLLVWFGLVRDAAVDVLPDAFRSRLSEHAALSRRQWMLAPIAAGLGAGTHVLWDSFTHAGRWGVEQVGWLQTDHAGVPGYSWLIWVSGALALVAVVLAARRQLRRRPARDRGDRMLPPWTVSALGGIAAVVASVAGLASWDEGIRATAVAAMVAAVNAVSIGLLVIAIWWRTTRWSR
jgi:Domain of unknown function (DUF4184)